MGTMYARIRAMAVGFCLVALLACVPAQARASATADRVFPDDGYLHFQQGRLVILGQLGVGPVSRPIVGPSADQVDIPEIAVQGKTDVTDTVRGSARVQTVSAQRRSPVSFDPRVRGYRAGQIYTQSDGSFWIPAREDLDSVLSKLDPSLIEEIQVIPGPYSVRYGPGFSFIDVQTVSTPRYEHGPEGHDRIGLTYRGNGEQFYARDTVYGGNSDWGFVAAYGNRTGTDYRSGDGERIPSSYLNQNFLGQLGFDVDAHSSLEFRYQRLDQGPTEYAARFFDIHYLGAENLSVEYVNDSPHERWDRFRMTGWWNQIRYNGDTEAISKRGVVGVDAPARHVIDRVDDALNAAFDPTLPERGAFIGLTNGLLKTAGGRAEFRFGEEEATHLSLGADVQFVEQFIDEHFSLRPSPPAFNGSPFTHADFPIYTNMPLAHSLSTGIYAELESPVRSFWTTTIGARCDWVHTSGAQPRTDRSSLEAFRDKMSQDDVLGAFYIANQIVVSEHWDADIRFGHAQRVPSLTQRYADGLFLAVIQSGFSRVFGKPTLTKERVWQIDAGVDADYEWVRGRASAFHSWITDYATYYADPVLNPVGARVLKGLNTSLATLAGFELRGEMDVAPRVSWFGTLQYVEGRDQEIHAPLSGISPLESRVGFRLHDIGGGEHWGIEAAARMVAIQKRLGTFRGDPAGVTTPHTLEEVTPGFTVFYVRAYWNVRENLHLIGGIENVFDKKYLEHLDFRLPADGVFPRTGVFSPGFTPYVGVERTF